MVVGLMKLHTDYEAFHKQLDQIAPVYPESPTLLTIRKIGRCQSNTLVGLWISDVSAS